MGKHHKNCFDENNLMKYVHEVDLQSNCKMQ